MRQSDVAVLAAMIGSRSRPSNVKLVQRGIGARAFVESHPVERIGRDLAFYLRSLGRQLVELESEQDRLNAELATDADASPVILPQQAAQNYRDKVAHIHEALTNGDAASPEAIEILRELIDHILVTPTERPGPVDLRVVGNLAASLVENNPETGVAVSMVAGAGLETATIRPGDESRKNAV